MCNKTGTVFIHSCIPSMLPSTRIVFSTIEKTEKPTKKTSYRNTVFLLVSRFIRLLCEWAHKIIFCDAIPSARVGAVVRSSVRAEQPAGRAIASKSPSRLAAGFAAIFYFSTSHMLYLHVCIYARLMQGGNLLFNLQIKIFGHTCTCGSSLSLMSKPNLQMSGRDCNEGRSLAMNGECFETCY